MSVIHKRVQSRNLSQYMTWIQDTDPTSAYFGLSQVPEVFTAGKNAFLIHGSKELVNTTEVLVEIVDVNGDTVYSAPVRNYEEGLARLVTVEIYNNTPTGMATITILGELRQSKDSTLAPEEWRGRYNVKWERRINIAPRKVNETQIRVYDMPTVDVRELLVPLKSVKREVMTVATPNGTTVRGIPSSKLYAAGNPFRSTYTVITSEPFFTKEMLGAEVMVNISGLLFTSSIDMVLNDTTIQVLPGYQKLGYLADFEASEVLVQYTASIETKQTQFNKSFAEIKIENLSTFSGDIYRAKVFSSPANSSADLRPVGDFRVKPLELLETHSLDTMDERVSIGHFTNQKIVSDYWIVGSMVSMSLYTGA